MTIFDYDSLPTIIVPYILRDIDNPATGVWVTNQETKEKLFFTLDDTSFFYDGYFTVDVTDLLVGINENTTLFFSVIDATSNPIYRDIVVFEQRLDSVADYEQNNETSEYIFS